jgi:hypothetical protein
MATVRRIRVPGRFLEDRAFVDIETRKVPCDYTAPGGMHLGRRWSVFLIGVAREGEIVLIDSRDDERLMMQLAAEAIGDGPVVYAATRQFDEMVLRGRFTNARRAHAPAPYYPYVLPRGEELRWINVRDLVESNPGEISDNRAPDIPSRDVPEGWMDHRRDMVLVHNLRDVCELILAAGKGNSVTRGWCKLMLFSDHHALLALAGSGQ